MSHTLRSYGGFFLLAARQELFHRGALIGRFAFYGVILLVFSRIWFVVKDAGQLQVQMREISFGIWPSPNGLFFPSR